jgi:hypothetical protein
MSSLFDCFFGFIFWGVAYFRMRSADKKAGRGMFVGDAFSDWFSVGLNVVIIIIGIFFLTVGTYATVEGIAEEFRAGSVRAVFSCASNGL